MTTNFEVFDDAMKKVITSPLHVLIGRQSAIRRVLAVAFPFSSRDLSSRRFIEEPENGVHPDDFTQVVDNLRSHSNCVIIITYSPYLLNFFTSEEVSLCWIDGDDKNRLYLRCLSESDAVKRLAKVLTLGEIWTLQGDKGLIKE